MFAITVVDQIVDSPLFVPDELLERVLVGHKKEEDIEAQEIETCLNQEIVEPYKRRMEPLERELGQPPKPSVEEILEIELNT